MALRYASRPATWWVFLTLFLVTVAGYLPAYGAKVKVEVEGVENELKENVMALLSIASARKNDPTPSEIQTYHKRADEEIRTALEPFGYYQPEIEGTLTNTQKDHFTARYVISPGEPLRVSSVALQLSGESADRQPFVRLSNEFPLRAGDVLDHRKYERGKASFIRAASDSGYFEAKFDTSEIRILLPEARADILLPEARADILLYFDTGPRFSFGEVTFEQDVVDERLLLNLVKFEPGEPYRQYKVAYLQQGLLSSPYFGRVEVVPRPDLAEDGRVPIIVELGPRKTQRYEIGAGYVTDTGPRVKFSMELRRLNRRGQTLETGVDASFVEQSWHAKYTIPPLYPRRSVYSIFTGYAHISTSTSESNKFVGGVNRSLKRVSWLENLSLAWEWEDYTVGSDTSTSQLLIPGASLAWKQADDDIVPWRGMSLRLEARGAYKELLADESFLQLAMATKLIHGFKSRYRFLGRAEVGHTVTDAFRRLPPSIRFFTGGDQSVRGYEYLSLGPLDENGLVIGGDVLVTASAEVEMRIVGKWAIAAFYDVGNAMNDWNDPLERGVGMGLRWKSPVGPFRLDVAHAVDRDRNRVHLWLGPDL